MGSRNKQRHERRRTAEWHPRETFSGGYGRRPYRISGESRFRGQDKITRQEIQALAKQERTKESMLVQALEKARQKLVGRERWVLIENMEGDQGIVRIPPVQFPKVILHVPLAKTGDEVKVRITEVVHIKTSDIPRVARAIAIPWVAICKAEVVARKEPLAQAEHRPQPVPTHTQYVRPSLSVKDFEEQGLVFKYLKENQQATNAEIASKTHLDVYRVAELRNLVEKSLRNKRSRAAIVKK